MTGPTYVERSEVIQPGPATAVAALLDRDPPPLAEGVPFLWHLAYLAERAPEASLGPDGHRAEGGIPTPPGPNRRRMFAGARVERHAALHYHRPATERVSLLATVDKAGRSGPLTFVTVRHQISQDGALVITEDQDLVYREAVAAPPERLPATPSGPPTYPPAQAEAGEWLVEADEVMLFRYSALTYNAHRIHYDVDYARLVEGYEGVLVHGPLQGLLMGEMAGRLTSPALPHGFAYRLEAPLCVGQGLVVSATPADGGVATKVRDAVGRVTATGFWATR